MIGGCREKRGLRRHTGTKKENETDLNVREEASEMRRNRRREGKREHNRKGA